MNFKYIHEGKIHANSSQDYMQGIGMDEDAINSTLNQKAFEEIQEFAKRRLAYESESDPLYMEWQYDKTIESEQAWRDKVAEIKTRYPQPAAE
ncbi:hypothetical protein [Shewanella sp. MBTL60-007]|uniref:hypothetical protein n=1 Tax=Shewanella sp. MBTL60-007 TaxID=2815911 RepID=UPI001BC73A51|nr:hypothetical protein [Shewanella sp. MBTL60-007]GIU12881.1 hypothetical protein TUM3792_01880 [Shewanella sp. MBTL60-007]